MLGLFWAIVFQMHSYYEKLSFSTTSKQTHNFWVVQLTSSLSAPDYLFNFSTDLSLAGAIHPSGKGKLKSWLLVFISAIAWPREEVLPKRGQLKMAMLRNEAAPACSVEQQMSNQDATAAYTVPYIWDKTLQILKLARGVGSRMHANLHMTLGMSLTAEESNI